MLTANSGTFLDQASMLAMSPSMTPMQPSLDSVETQSVMTDYISFGSRPGDSLKRMSRSTIQPLTPLPANDATSSPSSVRPIQQYGSSETITSLAWHLQNAQLLAAGMGLKWLRLYDLRQESAQPAIVISTRAVYGINMDPFHEHQFASFTEEGIIRVWDDRKANDAVLTLNSDSRLGLARIAFSPRRSGLLASLTKDSESVTLWELQREVSANRSVGVPQASSEDAKTTPALLTLGTMFDGPHLGVNADTSDSSLVLWRNRQSTLQ
jgi:WD40 repeat protein